MSKLGASIDATASRISGADTLKGLEMVRNDEFVRIYRMTGDAGESIRRLAVKGLGVSHRIVVVTRGRIRVEHDRDGAHAEVEVGVGQTRNSEETPTPDTVVTMTCLEDGTEWFCAQFHDLHGFKARAVETVPAGSEIAVPDAACALVALTGTFIVDGEPVAAPLCVRHDPEDGKSSITALTDALILRVVGERKSVERGR